MTPWVEPEKEIERLNNELEDLRAAAKSLESECERLEEKVLEVERALHLSEISDEIATAEAGLLRDTLNEISSKIKDALE